MFDHWTHRRRTLCAGYYVGMQITDFCYDFVPGEKGALSVPTYFEVASVMYF